VFLIIQLIYDGIKFRKEVLPATVGKDKHGSLEGSTINRLPLGDGNIRSNGHGVTVLVDKVTGESSVSGEGLVGERLSSALNLGDRSGLGAERTSGGTGGQEGGNEREDTLHFGRYCAAMNVN
jgi:hypothetical protein